MADGVFQRFRPKHIVFTSGGIGSWYAGKEVVERHGTSDVLFLYTDTRSEDRDLYRFLVESVAVLTVGVEAVAPVLDLCRRLPEGWEEGFVEAVAAVQAAAAEVLPQLVWVADGRDLWQLFNDANFIGNTRVDICSRALKRDCGRKWLVENFGPDDCRLYFGIDGSERERFYGDGKQKAGIRERWLPYQAFAPLCDLERSPSKCEMLKAAERLGVDPPRLYDEGFPHNNCFSGETRFLTDDGTKTLREMAGQDCRVLGPKGTWTAATVDSFGYQSLSCITLSRFGRTKVVYATRGHRWFAYTRERGVDRTEKTTETLQIGEKLVYQTARGTLSSATRPSAFGVAHGIVFGDGSRNDADKSGYTNPARVTLCGEFKQELLRYFPLSPVAAVPVGVEVRDLPRSYKELPSLSESKSYLYGWLIGYFATDGSVSEDGETSLSSATESNLVFVRDVCVRLGIDTLPISSLSRLGFGQEPTLLYRVVLSRDCLRDDFFVRSDQRERAGKLAEKLRRKAGWTVESIEHSVRSEEVFCAVVPDGHAFTLEDNVLTGNCGGICVKSGHAQFLHLLSKRPQWFAHHARKEQEFRDRTGKDVAIMRDRRGGKSVPLPMLEFQRQVESGEREVNPRDWGKGCQCLFPDEAMEATDGD